MRLGDGDDLARLGCDDGSRRGAGGLRRDRDGLRGCGLTPVSRCGLEATTVGSGGGAGAAAWTGGGGGARRGCRLRGRAAEAERAPAEESARVQGRRGAVRAGGAGARGRGRRLRDGVTSGPAVGSWPTPDELGVWPGSTACGWFGLSTAFGSPSCASAAAGDDAATTAASVTASGRRNLSVARAKAARLGGRSGRRASGTRGPDYQR